MNEFYIFMAQSTKNKKFGENPDLLLASDLKNDLIVKMVLRNYWDIKDYGE